jgi:LacI family transcriptional regulator
MPRAKRTTSLDVAKKAGVSRTTVSFVLNNVPDVTISETTRQRVLEAARLLDYHPNAAGRKLVSGKSRTLGLVLCQSAQQVSADALLPRVLLGFEQAAIQQGYQVLLKPVEPNDSLGYTKLVNENLVDGILLSGPRHDDQEIVRLHDDGFPVMLMGQLPGSHIPFVDIDASAGAETATTHLIERGHQRIAIITNAPLSFTSAHQRLEGFARAITGVGFGVDPALIQEGNYTPASGFEAMTRLLSVSPRPTAVFVASDVVAMGVIRAIRCADLRIPQDIALVGFDDIPLAEYFDPPLTTVHLPAFGLGLAAGERLIRLIQNEGLDTEAVFMQSNLIVRESS